MLALTCVLVVLVAQVSAWPHRQRDGDDHDFPEPPPAMRGPWPPQLCRIEGSDDDDLLVDFTCPDNCEELREQEVTWEDSAATGFFCMRSWTAIRRMIMSGRQMTSGFSTCKITNPSGSYVYLDLGCPEICELEVQDDEVTWDGEAAKIYKCRRPQRLDDDDDDEDEVQDDDEDQEVVRQGRRRHRAHHHRCHRPPWEGPPKPCKVVGGDGTVYMDLGCPDDCEPVETTLTWENDSDAKAHYCAAPEPTNCRHRHGRRHRRPS